MIVDNIETIKSLIRFDPKHKTIYQVQIIQRSKDNNTSIKGSNRARTVRSYHFTSLKQFQEKEQEIKDLCKFFKARAYININGKNLINVLFRLLEIVKDTLQCEWNGDTPASIQGMVDAAIAQTTPEKGKNIWLVDCDDLETKADMIDMINNQCRHDLGTPIITEIPTVNGCHLLTKKFESELIDDKYGFETVKKNSPTLLYCDVGD